METIKRQAWIWSGMSDTDGLALEFWIQITDKSWGVAHTVLLELAETRRDHPLEHIVLCCTVLYVSG